MNKTVMALAIAFFAMTTAAGSEKQDVMAVVQQWVDSLNNDDSKTMNAACADETSIIDDFPPHEWQGAGACARWKNDFDAFLKKTEVTGLMASILKPRHVDVTADRAYVVVPVNLSFEQKGKPFKEAGSIFTLVLRKGSVGWRITGWAWAAH